MLKRKASRQSSARQDPAKQFTQREYSEYLPHVDKHVLQQDADIETAAHGKVAQASKVAAAGLLLWQAFGTLGIVYGDIGTSPLYVLASVFNRVTINNDNLFGVVSCIFWSQLLLLVIKYALIVLHADDHGNGGAFALYAQLKRGIDEAIAAKEGLSTVSQQPSADQNNPAAQQHASTGLGKHKTSQPATDGAATVQPDDGQQGDPSKVPAAVPSRVLLPSDLTLATYSEDRERAQTMHGIFHAKWNPYGWRSRVQATGVYKRCLRILVVAGVGFIMGDGVLTPSMSVLSAVQGIQTPAPSVSQDVVIAITCVILLLLFTVQMFGTAKISYAFSPVVFIWLVFNMVCGIINIASYEPGIFRALSPSWAIKYLANDFGTAWLSLSSILLSFTGVEALFADLGHFNRPSIQLSCLLVVFPCITFTYLGQAAYLMHYPQNVANAFYASLPSGTFWPMFIFATLATVVASQALISAVFSIIMQAIAQGFFPRFHVKYTNAKHVGQVYINIINWVMACLCIIVVIAFKNSTNLGQAYGLAVNFDLIITTCLMSLIMIFVWRVRWPLAVFFFVIYFCLEGLYLSSSLLKVPHGGWFPLMLAAIYGLFMLTWYYGTSRKQRYTDKHTIMLDDLIDWQPEQLDTNAHTLRGERLIQRATGRTLQQTDGVGLFYSSQVHGTPQPLVDFVNRLNTVPKLTFVMTNRFVSVPYVHEDERLLIEPLTVPGFYHVVARYGYMEKVQQDDEFATSIIATLRALLTDALHGLGADTSTTAPSSIPHETLPPQPSETLSAAAEELNAAPLFNGHTAAASAVTVDRLDVDRQHSSSDATDSTVTSTATAADTGGETCGGNGPAETTKQDVEAINNVRSSTNTSLSASCKVVAQERKDALGALPGEVVIEETLLASTAEEEMPQHSLSPTVAGNDGQSAFAVSKHTFGSARLDSSGPVQRAPARWHTFSAGRSSLKMHGLPDAVVLGHASLDRSLSLADVKQGRGTKDLQRLALKRELQRLQEVDPAFLYAFGLTYIKAETRSNKLYSVFRKVVLEGVFTFLSRNLGSVAYREFNVPRDAFVELGSLHEV